MIKKAALTAVAVLAVLLYFLPAYSQSDIIELQAPAFENPERPPALFNHDEHNEKAELDDCAACHHGGEDCVLDKESTSEGTPCSDCHPVSPDKSCVTGLMNAYHQQCIGCHETMGKGPLTCGECHVDK